MPSRVSFIVLPLVVGLLTALVACGGSNASGGVATAGDDAGGALSYGPEAGPVDASDAAVEAMPAVAVYQGSPLCNASPATSCCYPDALNVCEPTSCVPPSDAGTANDAGGFYSQVIYGCHLAPAPTAVGAAADATSGAAVQPVMPSCMPAGLGLDGAACHESGDCAAGYECVGETGTCRHYCCAGNSACRVDQFCDIQQTTGATTMSVPVCMPIRQCDLLQPDACSAAGENDPPQTCAVVREDGAESCVDLGNATAGQSCETEHCAAGLVCLGATTRVCYTLCQMSVTGTCPTGQSCKGGPPLFLDPGVGVCQ
jgi:hypothetical protein